MHHGAKPWIADHNHPHYQAARNALFKGIHYITYSIIFKKKYLILI